MSCSMRPSSDTEGVEARAGMTMTLPTPMAMTTRCDCGKGGSRSGYAVLDACWLACCLLLGYVSTYDSLF